MVCIKNKVQYPTHLQKRLCVIGTHELYLFRGRTQSIINWLRSLTSRVRGILVFLTVKLKRSEEQQRKHSTN